MDAFYDFPAAISIIIVFPIVSIFGARLSPDASEKKSVEESRREGKRVNNFTTPHSFSHSILEHQQTQSGDLIIESFLLFPKAHKLSRSLDAFESLHL